MTIKRKPKPKKERALIQQATAIQQLLTATGFSTDRRDKDYWFWKAKYKGERFRSAWEAYYQSLNPEDEYEQVRIPFTYEENPKVFIVDFVNHKEKTLTEINPEMLSNTGRQLHKIFAARRWCTENGYAFRIVTEEYFLARALPDDLSDFDETTQQRLRMLYEAH